MVKAAIDSIEEVCTVGNIEKAFAKAGLFPFNKEVVLNNKRTRTVNEDVETQFTGLHRIILHL